ncbi:hypothetical protein ED312_09275 [Sinomicrobium pectinilyticum]|uniref:Uncharacterized protein n=1 Tax=Sinomicrobium pectinilyticum TaxID=1084421 RepID=A0A3N0EKC1_SINP1|nr:hypothetical protein ED312_09275 [Sinomicrobium pectinilyticum]
MLLIAFITTSGTVLLARHKEPSPPASFKIIVEKTANGIAMHGVEGTAWVDLSFSLRSNQSRVVNAHGMISLDDILSSNNEEHAGFMFVITKTKNGITLKGLKGTAWKALSFSLGEHEKQAIDQQGMTELH